MIEIQMMTVRELHAILQNVIDNGGENIPVVGTDCRARYPFQAYTVLDQSGYKDALLLYVRPDAHFAARETLPINWSPSLVKSYNDEADEIKSRCGAFA